MSSLVHEALVESITLPNYIPLDALLKLLRIKDVVFMIILYASEYDMEKFEDHVFGKLSLYQIDRRLKGSYSPALTDAVFLPLLARHSSQTVRYWVKDMLAAKKASTAENSSVFYTSTATYCNRPICYFHGLCTCSHPLRFRPRRDSENFPWQSSCEFHRELCKEVTDFNNNNFNFTVYSRYVDTVITAFF